MNILSRLAKERLTPERFWDSFDEHACDLCYAASQEAAYAARLQTYLQPAAIEAAIEAGLLPSAPSTQLEVLGFTDLQEHLAQQDVVSDVAQAVAASPVLARFLLLSLVSARAEATLSEWGAWKFASRGDRGAIDWNDPHTQPRFERAFEAMLRAEPFVRREWEESGLSLGDLLTADQIDGRPGGDFSEDLLGNESEHESISA